LTFAIDGSAIAANCRSRSSTDGGVSDGWCVVFSIARDSGTGVPVV
jgi:hypothetical protein